MTAIDSPDTIIGADTRSELTDGHRLIVDALKLDDVRTIYGLVGIPITDIARIAQASGIRYIGFRHESDAVHAAAAAGFLTKKPGVCLTVSGPGFLNGLVALANATTNCFPVAAMLDYARAGDTVVVTAIDRLGRSVAEVTRTIADLVERRSCCALT
jgi:oxalyl-CoA decarboxylase